MRADFNVPMKEGEIQDDFRIAAYIPTIKYLQEHGAAVILLSHLGEPKGFDPELSLKPIAERLTKLMGEDIGFVADVIGETAKHAAEELKPGGVLLFENLRFWPGETANDSGFARALASMGDCYVNDAFSVSHRAHASIVGLPKLLPSAAGLLLQKEVETLTRVRDEAVHPLVVLMGGAKAKTKIPFLAKFIQKSDAICLGGVLANTILAGKGIAVGRSLYEKDLQEETEKLVITNAKLHLPVDVVVSRDVTGNAETRIAPVANMKEDEMILDIGPDTIKMFSKIMRSANTIVWNGPLGFFETEKFAEGTYALAREFEHIRAYSVVGGGDVIEALDNLGLLPAVDFVSTGGGAMLELLAGEKLPGIEALRQSSGQASGGDALEKDM